ncbi:exodeoxyribonuclease VII large subunit [Cloacibacillus sp. An23]|uniref:exodeoxyribonuclease VII large subunit n=1 Tax=Cloacibacillus sp. An23 TaxID=1965591 RepID=UPI000B382158|nr:exodeoxyribonuclease VII large subunit [Cloacibacillus sp. An23]OUO92676.1 exodeoxyribonuclease VII large subunit [Cloacibacillus sp. An23]
MTAANNKIITVDEMTASVKEAVSREPLLQNLSVRGELLGFKLHTSGHAYFTLLGENSRVSCVLFRSYANSVLVWPKDGDEVLVRGRIDVYGARGSYQIYAVSLLPLGAGAKTRAKEALRMKLEREGIFDVRLKRPLPRYPERVAVITSPTGAALQDVLKLHALRYPCAEIVVVPSLMQGVGAAEEIVSAFARARRIRGLSCLMLVRGGGNRDDLDIFDDEPVVRAVRLCPVPVITGLGHQIDSTLADLAADAAAPTPSGAAERLFPDRSAISSALRDAERSMRGLVDGRAAMLSRELETAAKSMDTAINLNHIAPASASLKSAEDALGAGISAKLRNESSRLASDAARLDGLSPLSLLSKGYSICEDGNGEVLRSVSSLSEGARLSIIMRDGTAGAVVESISGETPFKEDVQLCCRPR